MAALDTTSCARSSRPAVSDVVDVIVAVDGARHLPRLSEHVGLAGSTRTSRRAAPDATAPLPARGRGRREDCVTGRCGHASDGREPPGPALASSPGALPVRRPHARRARAARAARHGPRRSRLRARQPARDGEGRAVRPLLALPGHAAAAVPRGVRRLACPPAGRWDGARGRARGAALRAHLRRLRRRLGRPARRRARGLRVGLERADQGAAAPAAGAPTSSSPRATSPTTRRCPAAATATTATPSSARSTRRRWTRCSAPTPPRSRACARGWTRRFPRADGEPEAARARAVNAKALDLLRGLLPAASLSHMGIYATRPVLRAADPAPDRPSAARGAPLRRADPRARSRR